MFHDSLNPATAQANKLVEDMQSLDWKCRDTIATDCHDAAVAIAGERWLGSGDDAVVSALITPMPPALYLARDFEQLGIGPTRYVRLALDEISKR